MSRYKATGIQPLFNAEKAVWKETKNHVIDRKIST